MSDRIIIMREGAIVGEFARGQTSEEGLVAMAAGASHGE
jgi:ABC-type sugar transport system ATPase subunit